MSSVALIANGVIHDFKVTAELVKLHKFIVAVDGGLQHCLNMHIIPNLIIGDLDSAPQELLSKYPQIKKQKFSQDKDETDLELAVKGVNSPAIEKIVVFGALERRTDHALANLHLARQYPNKIFLENEREVIFSIAGHLDIPCRVGQIISLIPLGSPTKGVTTQGLKWELQNATFDKNFMSISNVCTSHLLHIEIQEGDLICCLTK